MSDITVDDLVFDAFKKRKSVTLYLCRGDEGGFGVKIDGKIIARNLAWECLEVRVTER